MTARRHPGKSFFRGVEPVSGNQLRLLQGGAEFFPALIAAIDAARDEIHLETYIFNADPSAGAVRDALIGAARRGVQVRVLIDGVGSRELPAAWQAALEATGASVLVYRPLVNNWRSDPHSLRRLHRKLAVIDARVAFLGGMNIIDDFEPVRLASPRLDFSVEVRGPLLVPIHRSVRHLWRLVALTQLQGHGRNTAIEPSWPTDGHVRAAFVVRDNFAHRRDIERVYLAALALARDEIVIANAYFLPGRRFRKLLKNAAARGVPVHLLVQGHTDHPFFQSAARALYRDLLAAGVNIYEYQASELHAKVAVVDGHWATVGSSNIDPFSLLLAREANIVVDDAGFARDLRQRLQQAIGQSVALDPADWQRRPWPQRMMSWLAYGGVRLMVGLAGAGRLT
ncbi:cardiolipin synthase ClsB [Thiobacillus sp.]|uniref:cardiolipin synthase ClsB n=1 Tax=Thiobacillus sp. TaxID=924 RepID=UPI0017ED52BF|nr:cardiolipin synthase ClsB [Thiobacillus sp.]MBC2732558.1 cardiolipin synthase ClsB [Thiobacillus sp.]MBC2741296.1 cardiolipin synthase ClsB [Thiobacillus sp.]MBC2759045.1 cardiolipin synthase ClsB [Thiobacillus sp.]